MDISYNNLSNGALEILMKTFREMQVRVDLLNLSGNWFSNLDPLVENMSVKNIRPKSPRPDTKIL